MGAQKSPQYLPQGGRVAGPLALGTLAGLIFEVRVARRSIAVEHFRGREQHQCLDVPNLLVVPALLRFAGPAEEAAVGGVPAARTAGPDTRAGR